VPCSLSFLGWCFAALVVFPQRHRTVDVLLLTLLGSAADQDDDLQAILGQLQSKVLDSDRKLLTQAQRGWLKFRDAHFQYIWAKSMLGEAGTLGPIVVGDWSRDMLKQRVCELEPLVTFKKTE
jgi:uncharacterized protein YecT (DUF1311 family)